MRLGEDLQRLEQRDEIPSDGAAPDERRSASDGVGPDGLLELVVAVLQET